MFAALRLAAGQLVREAAQALLAREGAQWSLVRELAQWSLVLAPLLPRSFAHRISSSGFGFLAALGRRPLEEGSAQPEVRLNQREVRQREEPRVLARLGRGLRDGRRQDLDEAAVAPLVVVAEEASLILPSALSIATSFLLGGLSL